MPILRVASVAGWDQRFSQGTGYIPDIRFVSLFPLCSEVVHVLLYNCFNKLTLIKLVYTMYFISKAMLTNGANYSC